MSEETPEFQFQLQFPLQLQLEYPSSTWVHIKIIRASLAFLSHNSRREHRPVAKGVRWGVALWPVPAAGCWHRFGLNISHYFSFNDGMQWKRNSEFWNVCLHASPGRWLCCFFLSIFLAFSFVCLIYVWKIHDPTPNACTPGQLLLLLLLQLLQLK